MHIDISIHHRNIYVKISIYHRNIHVYVYIYSKTEKDKDEFLKNYRIPLRKEASCCQKHEEELSIHHIQVYFDICIHICTKCVCVCL
jgi:hypothetical protein